MRKGRRVLRKLWMERHIHIMEARPRSPEEGVASGPCSLEGRLSACFNSELSSMLVYGCWILRWQSKARGQIPETDRDPLGLRLEYQLAVAVDSQGVQDKE